LPGSFVSLPAGAARRRHHPAALNPEPALQRQPLHRGRRLPLAAEFTLACPDIPALTATDNLNQVSHPHLLIDISVYDLASNLGANPDSPTATWYEHVDGTRATLSIMIQPAASNCTAYLFAHRYPT
jgi:hypothetical protein